jgi:hypothetical protein
MMIEAIHSSKTSILTRDTRHQILDDSILYFLNSFPVQNGLKQGDALSPLFFNFALEYDIRKVYKNQAGLKLNGTYQLLLYAEEVDLLGHNTY